MYVGFCVPSHTYACMHTEEQNEKVSFLSQNSKGTRTLWMQFMTVDVGLGHIN